MPLPQEWHGLFWSKESQGDSLFDMTPEAFVQWVREHEADLPAHPAFYVAGAAFDLLLNEHSGDARQRSDRLATLGKDAWPNLPYEKIAEMVELYREKSAQPEPERELAGLIVSNMIGMFFGGPVIFAA